MQLLLEDQGGDIGDVRVMLKVGRGLPRCVERAEAVVA